MVGACLAVSVTLTCDTVDGIVARTLVLSLALGNVLSSYGGAGHALVVGALVTDKVQRHLRPVTCSRQALRHCTHLTVHYIITCEWFLLRCLIEQTSTSSDVE